MKRKLLAATFLVVRAALPAKADTTVTWGHTDGTWSNPADWTPNVVPNNNGSDLYDVSIPTGGSVSLDINPTIQQLAFVSGTISGDSTTLTIDGLFNWSSSGDVAMTGAINADGGMNIYGAGLSSGTINNNGTATWSEDTISGPSNTNQAIFNNNLGSNFNIQCDQAMYGYPSTSTDPSQFNNYGTVTKSVTTGTTTINFEFNNSGTVNVQSGTLALNGGGNETGAFAISSGATFEIGGGGNFQIGSSIGGLGNVVFFDAGTYDLATINGTYDPAGTTTVTGGAVTFSSPNVSIGNALTINGGTATFDTGAANVTPSSITFSSGTFTGSDTITTSGAFNWTGGTLGQAASTQIINANGGMSISGDCFFYGGTINNNASATWTGGYIQTSYPNATNLSSIFNNNLGATLNIVGPTTYDDIGTQIGYPYQFNNYGTLIVSTASGSANIGAQFTNSGTVEVQAGYLGLDGGGNQTGDFDVSSGATLEIGGNTNFQSGSSINGGGNLYVTAGTSTVSGTYSLAGTTTVRGGTITFSSPNVSISSTLTVNGGTAVFDTGTTNIDPSSITLSLLGTITGSDVITTPGLFTWSDGTVGMGTSSETINANGGISIGGDVRDTFLAGTINNNATATWSGNSILGPTVHQATSFNNNLGANFNIQCDQAWGGFGSSYPDPNQFNNFGTLTKSVTIGITSISAEFNNSGTVNVETGTLMLDGGGNQTGSFNISSGATLEFAAGGTFQSGSSVGGGGNLLLYGGTLNMNTPNNYTGSTTVKAGTLIEGVTGALPGGNVTISGGSLMLGAGTGISQITSLAMSGSGVLDISNNEVIINYGNGTDPIASIAGWIADGYNGGKWNGAGIVSSSARTLTNGLRYGVGFADGNDGVVSGLSSGQIEIKYTLLGDANLDGAVNGSDFSILAANFGLGVTNWDQGNFLYGSSVNGSDFSALAANFGQGDSGADASVSVGDIAALDAFAAANGLPMPVIASVPEPGSLGLLAAAGCMSMRSRRHVKRT